MLQNYLASALILVILILVATTVHKVEEGHVAVYWRGGALLNTIAEPGYHIMVPLLTTFANVQVTLQTDMVTNIPCGTSGGVVIFFERVEVVNRLKKEHVYQTIKNYTLDYDKVWIFDKIHHELNQFCSLHTLQEVYTDLFDTVDERLVVALQETASSWAPGLEIISCRVTKPKIPESIRQNYEMMEAERTKLMIAIQNQKVVEKRAETAKKQAIIEAEKTLEVARITVAQTIRQKEAEKRLAEIDAEMLLEREKAFADAEFYAKKRETEANAARLTPEYLQNLRSEVLASLPKVFVGTTLDELWGVRQLPSTQQANTTKK